ncbi:MAG: phenylalanine--tRNA ligase subunit beta [Chloroflexota bacterium]
MRVPLQWIADYVDIDLPVEELARRLTMIGLNVEGIDRIGAGWEDVITAKVVELHPHPSSRKPLTVATVDFGKGVVTLVTGAQNVSLGDMVALVPVGGTVPHGPDGEPMLITPRPMAGIVSEGMLASARELGISQEHEGIYILPSDVPVGEPLRRVLGDDVLDLEIQPNRPDTLSVIGIAREVAAVTEQQLSLPNLDAITGQIDSVDQPSVALRIEAPDLCSRYTALRIENVSVIPSPFWLRRRLEAAGVRSINLPVDLTNYVMLEYGQPTHAFDARSLQSGAITVRRARPGETLRTLDGVQRVLTPETLVIADGETAVGLAGVMGGENSEIGTDTRSLILESATFNAANVYRTARTLNLRTEASARFEKDLPPEQAILAGKRYLQLLAQLSPEPLRVYEISDEWINRPEQRTINVKLSEVERQLGLMVGREQAAEALSVIGFEVDKENGRLAVGVPYWRRADVQQPIDLVEEVGRLIGYEAIPAELPRKTLPPQPAEPERELADEIRRTLLGAGINEAVTGTLSSMFSLERLAEPAAGAGQESWSASIVSNPAGIERREAGAEPIALLNPASRERDVLRTSLLPGLLDAIARNVRNTDENLAFFEIARTYFPRVNELPYERRGLAVAVSGLRRPLSWQEPAPGPYSFYDLKGILVAVLEALRIEGWDIVEEKHPALHPGRAAGLRVGQLSAGFFGQLHPEVAARFDIRWPVQVAEIDLDTLIEHRAATRQFSPLPRYPAARRDIAVILPVDVPAAEVERVVRHAGGDLLTSVRLFDVFEGPSLPENTRSLALALELRSPNATLGSEDIAALTEGIVQALTDRLGAVLRE